MRSRTYFPEWLLERRRRAEQALISVVATSYLLGVSTRRVEKQVGHLGIAQLSKSQVSEMAIPAADHLDATRADLLIPKMVASCAGWASPPSGTGSCKRL